MCASPLRGLKGLWWEPRDYFGWPSFLAGLGYNLLLVCYTAWPELSVRWRHPLPASDRAILRALADEAVATGPAGLQLGVAINPCIGTQSWSPRTAAVRFHSAVGPDWFTHYWRARRPGHDLTPDAALRCDSDADLATLYEQCRTVHACGVRSIALCLDDVQPEGSDPAQLGRQHAHVVSALHAELQRLRPTPRLLFVPTYYWTDGLRAHPAYAAALAAGLAACEQVDLFWTGEQVRSQAIDAGQAQTATELLGRAPVVWLNYASNDAFRFALQLPPARPPAADLLRATRGLLVNPMRQVGLSRLHAQVMGAYLRDPSGFSYGSELQAAARTLCGPAGPWLERVMSAWARLPDSRTLSLRAADRDVRSRVSLCLAELDEVLPDLRPWLPMQARIELEQGVARVRLLGQALQVHQAGTAAERARVLARLADTDDETACDARAVLAAPGPQ